MDRQRTRPSQTLVIALLLASFGFGEPAAAQALRRHARETGLDVQNRGSGEPVDAAHEQARAIAAEKLAMEFGRQGAG